MAVSTEILRTYRAPRSTVRRLLAGTLNDPRGEARALAWLMGGCLLIFVAQWPRLSREVALAPDGPPLQAQVSITFFAWLFIWPLLFYGIAGLSHLVARVLGGKGSFFGARVALFWSVLSVAPLMLLHGLVAGFIGPGFELTLVGGAVALAFLSLWLISLWEAERATSP